MFSLMFWICGVRETADPVIEIINGDQYDVILILGGDRACSRYDHHRGGDYPDGS
jgi:hypothetical protein